MDNRVTNTEMTNYKSILLARIRFLISMSKELALHLFEDETDEYEAFYFNMMVKHNKKLEKLNNGSTKFEIK